MQPDANADDVPDAISKHDADANAEWVTECHADAKPVCESEPVPDAVTVANAVGVGLINGERNSESKWNADAIRYAKRLRDCVWDALGDAVSEHLGDSKRDAHPKPHNDAFSDAVSDEQRHEHLERDVVAVGYAEPERDADAK